MSMRRKTKEEKDDRQTQRNALARRLEGDRKVLTLDAALDVSRWRKKVTEEEKKIKRLLKMLGTRQTTQGLLHYLAHKSRRAAKAEKETKTEKKKREGGGQGDCAVASS